MVERNTIGSIPVLLADLVGWLPDGEYGGVVVRRGEGGETTIVYGGWVIPVDRLCSNPGLAARFPPGVLTEALWRLAVEACRRYGRVVNDWLVFPEAGSSDEFTFLARRGGRVVYAVMPEMVEREGVAYRISMSRVERVPFERVRRALGFTLYRVFPWLGNVVEVRPAEVRVEAPPGEPPGAEGGIERLVEWYLSRLLERPEAARRWLLGDQVYLPLTGEPALQTVNMVPGVRFALDSRGWSVYIDPALAKAVAPTLYERVRRAASIESDAATVAERLRRLLEERGEPIPVDEASKRLGLDLREYLPYLATRPEYTLFKHKGRLYITA